MERGNAWLEHLSEAECWQLVGSESVGRIGILVDSAPEIYPVNFASDGESVLFRTDEGTKLRGLERSPSVCCVVPSEISGRRVGRTIVVTS